MTKYNHSEYDAQNGPDGDGDVKCPKCKGRGVTYVPGSSPPVSIRCECTIKKDCVYNMENGWKGLSRAVGVESSPLVKYVGSNLWITAPVPDFRNHMKTVAEKMGHKWTFKVSSDSELVSIWLSKLGDEVRDPDFQLEEVSENTSLNRFVGFPDLLVIQLGVKVASNRETPSVVQEAISLRYHQDKPTWITDQPYARFEEGHKAYSRNLVDALHIYDFRRINVGNHEEYIKPSVNGFSELSMPQTNRPTTPAYSQPNPNPSIGVKAKSVFADDVKKKKYKNFREE